MENYPIENKNTWMINRIGMLNFWYYDEEEFEFKEGRLLLRGSNGSGKSVTMQSFIPLLLDGNKSPERLDPFGSRARKMENYLLGEDENGKEESTGYLYMEFIKPETENYLTIGMGLRGRKGKPLDFWGFCINDGRRIAKDFFLCKDVGDKIPLSKVELKNRIGEGGEVHESQKDYMAMVNTLLFGFDSIEDYDELIKLLIQLRTPKLSKDFKPTVVYEIMNNSLQPLSDEDLRPMSEAIENMDNIKSQLEVLKESKRACDKIYNDYVRYNKFVAMEKSRDYLKSCEKLNGLIKNKEKTAGESQGYLDNFQRAKDERESLKLSQTALSHKEQELKKHDSYTAKEELGKLLEKITYLEKERANKAAQLDLKKRKEREITASILKHEDQTYEQEKELNEYLDEMSEYADKLYFYEHTFMSDELLKNIGKEYNFSGLKSETDKLKGRITQTRKAYEKEKVQNEIYDRALLELEQARKEKEDALRELDKAELMLSEIKEEFIEKVYAWEKENAELKITREELTGVSRAVNHFGTEGGTYDDILSAVRGYYNIHRDTLNTDRLTLKSEKEKVNGEIDLKQKDLDNWKKQKDPEPFRDEKLSLSRKRLIEMNIPHIPLYKACDFRPEIEPSLRGRLEEALLEMGILDALIVPAQYRNLLENMPDGMVEKVIFPEPKVLRCNLSMFLQPVDVSNDTEINRGITISLIDECLSSIALNDMNETPFIHDKGTYKQGIIAGKISNQYNPKFIGLEARKRYREENIRRIEEEISALRSIVRQIDEQINNVLGRLQHIDNEFSNFPKKDDLETAVKILEKSKFRLESAVKEVEKRDITASKAYYELKQIREEIMQLTSKLEFGHTLEAYLEAETNISTYREMIMGLESRYVELLSIFKRLESLKEQKEDIIIDIDNISYDVKNIEKQLKEESERKLNYEEILKSLNYEDINRQIEECLQALKEIPEKIEKAASEIATNKERYDNSLKSLELLERQISSSKTEKELREWIFKKEYALKYVIDSALEEKELAEEIGDSDVERVAKKIYTELKDMDKDGKTSNDYSTGLQSKYHENRQFLTEYNLIIESLFELTEQYEDEDLRKIAVLAKRIDFIARVQGKEVNFIALKEFIENSIEENEKLLKESDRQLFEDILANTVGKKIRGRIYHSEMWVKKMNNLMESMNTSSGLSFSLAWRNRVAENEEEIGTKELVEILRSDSQLLSEEQMENLSKHFRSKIAAARKEQEDRGISQSFHAIMKEVLDYRKWFEFQLFFRKTGENKKELTNNAFDKFSGGEKAMAMYVPLFSAVYARYESAKKGAPRIISLDEAFAGVDENNIRDMFRLLEELKLSFIINSQILWGDYDTVPALSICELIRPNNADFVSVIRYRWNGKIKELVV